VTATDDRFAWIAAAAPVERPGDGTGPASPVPEEIREVVETLAALERGPGSPGEAQAARWLAERLEQAGCEVQIDEEPFHDGYARLIGSLAATAAAGGLLALGRRTRRLGGTVAALAGLAIADDISNGPRVIRRRTAPKRTQNVVAVCGDRDAERTLVVMAHHDAAPTGRIFDDRLQTALGERFPGVLERIDTSLPLWWLVLAGPGAVALGARRRRRGQVAAGVALSTVATAVFADIARSPIVPGANDNLTAVAVLVGLARRLAERPAPGIRVLLVSCGAEEVIQGGIHAFAARHFPRLDRERTWFLNLDTVGSPELVLLEGEGPVVMEDYFDRRFRDLIARVADEQRAPVRRGMRARNSTDAVIPSRAGYPTATFASMNRYKALTHYHQMSDTPENVGYRTVAHALLVTEAVARELATSPWLAPPA
jgi:hypothetical protein